jgi:hypothetical protein
MNDEQLHELLYQTLETELGGVAIYETALRCVQKDELRAEFKKYHEQTTHHVELVEGLLRAFGLHPGAETPGRRVVRHLGDSLVAAMERALKAGPPHTAELVAAECVTLAQAKDQLDWELIGEVLSRVRGEAGSTLRAANEEIGEQRGEHLDDSCSSGRERWIEALGLPAVLPLPEQQEDAKTATGAAPAKRMRTEMT